MHPLWFTIVIGPVLVTSLLAPSWQSKLGLDPQITSLAVVHLSLSLSKPPAFGLAEHLCSANLCWLIGFGSVI